MAVLTREVTEPLPMVRGGVRPRWVRHLPFAVVLALAAALRVVALIAYQGVLWFPDSHSYLAVAVDPYPWAVRPQGYAFFLRLLEPFHSFLVVAAVQHAMGLAAGALIYVVLRRRFRTPVWVATLCAAPVLFDAYQLELEHMLLSDTLFWFLVLVAVLLVVGWPEAWPALAGAGLALGLATVTRSLGLPLLAVFAGYLLLRRRWRAVAITAATCLLPVAAYAIWFHGTWGTYGLTNSTGIFIYGRTAVFADCRIIRPPASERDLCPSSPVGQRPVSPDYIWHDGALGRMNNFPEFTPAVSARTGDFARRAILAQPGAYLDTGLSDFAKTFAPSRVVYPTRYDVSLYEFPAQVQPQKLRSHPMPWLTLGQAIRTYTADPHSDGLAYVDPGAAAFMRAYQKVMYLPGPPLALLLAGGGVVLLVRRRWPAALPWLGAVTLLVVPPFTASFDHRYVIPAVPLACLALGIAVSRGRFRTGGGSALRPASAGA